MGCPKAYRDFVRFIHVRYDWTQGQETVEKLNMRARGAILVQKAPELSYEVFRTAAKAHEGIDAHPDLKAKKKYAAAHSTFRTDVRDTCTVSYVGQMDWGGMQTISIRSTPLRMETWSLKSMPFRISSVSVFR